MTAPNTKILVAQTFESSRNMIAYILRHMGFNSIEKVTDGAKALRELSSGEYGIVISDGSMQGLDGLALLRTVREDAQLKDLVFLIVTAENDRDKVVAAKACGVDGYIIKPFSAELLCKRMVEALQSRHPELKKAAPSKPQNPFQVRAKKPAMKIFGEAAAGIASASPQNWSRSLSHLSFSSPSVLKQNLQEAMHILSHQFDMMKADDDFVSVEDMLAHVESTIANTEKQAEKATLIADTANDISQALADIENAPGGSPKSREGLAVINQSAARLADMIDSFDKEAADIIGMLSGMENMVQQAHVREIDASIKASYDLEVNGAADGRLTGKVSASSASFGVVGRLAKIQAGSESAREALSIAAGGITNVIERINTMDQSSLPSFEVFQQLRSRIDHIMDTLDDEISMASTLVTGMEEAASVKQNIDGPAESNDTRPGPAAETAKQQNTKKHEKSNGVPPAFKKLINNRILMIDIIKTDHNLCLQKFRELLGNNDVELLQTQLPGRSACSLTKWLDRQVTNKDFHDPTVCRQIAALSDDLHVHACRIFELYKKGRKDDAQKNYQAMKEMSDRINGLFDKLQDDLREKI